MNWSGARVAILPPVLRWVGVLLAIGFAAAAAGAQGNKPYTLHVNVRLVQVPTLVLGPTLQPMTGLKPEQFTLRLDSGPKFKPSDARLEGNDPISLAILLDLSGDQTDLLERFDHDFGTWVKAAFGPQDRIAVYGVDCEMVRTMQFIPADSQIIQQALENVIHSRLVHGAKSHPACGRSLRLWDSLAVISRDLEATAGRRVILAVTNGYDGKSKLKWTDVQSFDIYGSIAIFGLNQPSPFFSEWRQADRFSSLCQLTGGLVMGDPLEDLPQTLIRFVEMLRGRYILEFTEPANMTGGLHRIDVRLDSMDAFIRTSGVTAALEDPAMLNDPTVLPRDTSKAPVVGNKRPKKPD
jgi:hypothetical protein